MKRLHVGCALLTVLAISSAEAAEAPQALDRSVALIAPVEDLARSALLSASSRFVEVERPTFTGMAGPDAALSGLRFATAPESAGNPGLCRATTAWISFVDGTSPIETSVVFKIVGDLKPLPDMWNDAYGAELSRKCSTAGRVIPTESADFGQSTFFRIGEAELATVWPAARALQIAIESAKAGSAVVCAPQAGLDPEWRRELAADDPEVIEDRENREGCAQAAATLAGLSLGRLTQMEIAPCPDGKPRFYCLSAVFLRHANFNRQALWRVSLTYQAGASVGDDVSNVSAVTLSPDFAIYD